MLRAIAVLLVFAGCAGESTECTEENNCFLDPAGNATCMPGTTWVDPYTPGDYRCAPVHEPDCQPLTCTQAIAECGQPDDGCGGSLDCGTCFEGYECGADFQCRRGESEPMPCHAQGIDCGPASDGCGNTLDCGDCPSGYDCESGQCRIAGCTSRASTICIDGDLYWRDSCGQTEELRQDCGDWGCAGEQCLTWSDYWTCPPDYYDAADGCDCACGTPDPDCALSGQTLYNCDPGEICSAEGECVDAPCEHECELGSSWCQVGYLRQCITGADGCRVWGTGQSCPTGVCADDTSCSICTHECSSLGAQVCSDGAVVTCVTGSDDCYDWSAPVACGSGFCADSQACGACDNQCSAGETRCTYGQLESCVADANGCLDFGAPVACELGCADATRCAVCEPTSCAAEGKDCGAIDDLCGGSLDCGTCTGHETCGGGGTANVCGCIAESDLQFCFRLGKDCGDVTAADNCGSTRTVACGTCPDSESCEANVCTPYSEPFNPICNPEGWCWEHPAPFSHSLNDVHVLAANDIWAVGSEHFVLHFDGTTWSGTFDGKRSHLNALWVRSASDIWAVGDAGAVIRRQGGSWTEVTELSQDLSAIYGFAANDVWVGGGYTVWHFDGTTWTPHSLPGTVTGLWGAASDDLWAVGKGDYYNSNGFLAHWDGSTWELDPNIVWRFDDIHGFATDDVWAVADGHVMRWNGVYWADVANHDCTSIWGASSTDLWLSCWFEHEAQWDRQLVHYDGTSFTGDGWEIQTATVGGDQSGTRIAVSKSGVVARYLNGQWVRLAPTQTLTSAVLDSVQVFDGGDALVHGGYGTNLVRRNGWWQLDPADVDRNYCVWGFSVDDYWIGGMDTSSDPIAVHKQDGILSNYELATSEGVRYPEIVAIWGTPDDLHGVGQTYWNYSSGNYYYNYGFYHFDGTEWTAPETNATTDTGADSVVSFIDGASPSFVWAIDEGQTIWRLLYGAWQRFTTGSPLTGGDMLAGLWVESTSRVHFTGNFGVLTFDEATGYGAEQPVPGWSDSFAVVRGLRDSAAHGRVAIGDAGERGVAWIYDDGAWQVQSVFARKLRDIDVDGTQLVAVGEGGHIYRKR